MSLESELLDVWKKYEPQREAERNAARIQEEAAKALRELNESRTKLGLSLVGEYQYQSGLQQWQANYVYVTPQKTWRDEMNESLLATIRRSFT